MKSYLIIKNCQARYIFIIFNNLFLRIQNSSKYLSEQSILSTTGNTTTTKSSYCRFAKQSYMKLKAIVKEENSSEKVNSCREASFVRQPYLNVKRVHIGPQGKKAFGGPDQKCFDHYAFYVGYSITNVFYIAINAAKGVWGLSP